MRKKSESLVDLFNKNVLTTNLIAQGSSGLVAVSGGVDSVVLLELLISLTEKMRLKLGVAHFNHGTRGQDSDADEVLVRDLADNYRLPFYCGYFPQQLKSNSESWEAYARHSRYRFFKNVCKKHGFDWIATAHHIDDQAETILMRVIEGSGVSGLTGIRENYSEIIRPLLPFSKNQILDYARKKRLCYREDDTNRNTAIKRNYIRHELLPKIRKLNPNFPNTASQLAGNMREIDELINWEVQRHTKRIVLINEMGQRILDLDSMLSTPMLIQKRLIYDLIVPKDSGILWRHHIWLQLETFLRTSTTGDIMRLPSQWELLRDRNQFLLRKIEKNDKWKTEKVLEFTTGPNVSISVGEFRFTMTIMPMPVQFSGNPTIEYTDYTSLMNHKLKLRPWKSGDRMKPLGMNGYKKVSDILVDEKIDRFKKDSQFVLMADNQIVWLCGIQLDDRFKVREETRQTAQLSWGYTHNHI